MISHGVADHDDCAGGLLQRVEREIEVVTMTTSPVIAPLIASDTTM